MSDWRPKRRRVAIVTGASRQEGIGAAICRALASDGVDIFFTSSATVRSRHAMGQRRRRTIRGYCGRWSAPACGRRRSRLIYRLQKLPFPSSRLSKARLACSSLIVVNNAAYSTSDGVDTLNAATLDAHYAVNVRGTMLLERRVRPALQLGTGGRIINMTSGQSKGPMPGELAYGATKGAIEAFTISLAAAVASRGITVHAAQPGADRYRLDG